MKKISFKMCDNFKISLLARNNVYELENNATILEIDCDVDEALTYKLHVLHKDEKNVLLMDKNESSISTMLTDAYFSEKGIYYIQIEGIKNDFRIVSNQIRLEVGAFINAEHIPTPEEQSIIDRLAIKVTTLETDVDLLNTGLEEEKKTRSDADEQLQNNINALGTAVINMGKSIPSKTSQLTNDSNFVSSDVTDGLSDDLGLLKDRVSAGFLNMPNHFVMHSEPQNIQPYFKQTARNNIDAASVEDIPKNTSELNNDSGFITGPVVRTVNGEAPDASGNVNVKGGGGEGTVKSVNNVLPDNNGNVSLPMPEAYDDTKVKADIAKNASDIAKNTSSINALNTKTIAMPQDVQINGTSILDDNKVANIPMANSKNLGVVKTSSNYGVITSGTGWLQIYKADDSDIDARTQIHRTIVPNNLDYAVKSAICDGKGAEWTEAEKVNARTRIGAASEAEVELLYKITQGQIWDFVDQQESGQNLAPKGTVRQSLISIDGKSEQEASPTPDSPQPIINVEQLNFKVVTGKNLFDLNDFGNKYITAGSSLVGRYPVYVGVGKTVTLSTDYLRKSGFTSIFLLEREDDTATSALGAYNEHPRTVTAVSDYVYIGLYFDTTQEYQTTYRQLIEQGVHIQLEYGDSATAYEPYREELHTITPPFPLNKIGDYYDFANIESGEWVRNIYSRTVNSSDVYSYSTNRNAVILKYTDYLAQKVSNGGDQMKLLIKSDNFTGVSWNSYINNDDGVATVQYSSTGETESFIQLRNLSLTTVGMWKNWLDSNNTLIMYALMNSISEPIEATDLEYLKSLQNLDNDKFITITDQNGNDISYLMKYLVKLSEAI